MRRIELVGNFAGDDIGELLRDARRHRARNAYAESLVGQIPAGAPGSPEWIMNMVRQGTEKAQEIIASTPTTETIPPSPQYVEPTYTPPPYTPPYTPYTPYTPPAPYTPYTPYSAPHDPQNEEEKRRQRRRRRRRLVRKCMQEARRAQAQMLAKMNPQKKKMWRKRKRKFCQKQAARQIFHPDWQKKGI